MEKNNKNEMTNKREDNEVLWALLFGVVAFIALAVISCFVS